MKIGVLGMSHKTAPLELRERFAVGGDELGGVLDRLIAHEVVEEVVVLSTCNRVEAYVAPSAVATSHRDVHDAVSGALLTERGLALGLLDQEAYWLVGRDAIHHVFRVASSLDSMVVGEPQILGQLKEATHLAREAGTVGSVLGRVLDRAFSAAKRVRTETGIARQVVSIGSVAVDLAGRIFDRFDDTKVLIVGAGKMAEATARSLSAAGASRVYVTNRSFERATSLAQRHGWRSRSLDELEDLLVLSDVVITSTGASRPIIDLGLARRVVKARKYRPLFFVDIAVPRDVDAAVGELDSVYLYNVDDLEGISRRNLEERRQDADDAERLVATEIDEMDQWFRSLEVKPTLAAIRHRAEGIALAELERTLHKRMAHLGPDERRALEKMMSATVSMLLHPTMATLRESAELDNGRGAGMLAAARRLHGVDQEPG